MLPFSRRNWLALAPDIRLATIRTNTTKQITASHIERHALRVAKAEAKATAPAAVAEKAPAPAPGPRYVVPCASGCGEFLPAKSAQPVSIRCKSHASKPKPRPSGDAGLELLLVRLRSEVQDARTGVDKRKFR
ncbi:hypothetical protein D9M72_568530 [compost metagenome]